MTLRLYNTLTKQEEEFIPIHPGKVRMYTCGPTVYGRPHIGNYASFLMADLLRRWLEAGHGYEVTHVKNITDVGHLLHDADHGDDKIQKEAEKQKVHPLEIAKKYTEEYLKDEKNLGFMEPKFRPRATEFVEQMQTMVAQLLKSGHAYPTDDGIYFDVTSKTPTPYGTLSGNILDQVKAGARIDINQEKRHPADFALWKFCVGDNAHHVLRWPSPNSPKGETYPEGFPGWHIECSAMSRTLLGDQIDIHTGGEDNIFPHHECEIAQSESVTGKKPFVRYWIHRRRINMGSEKMSKSLGNMLILNDIQEMGYSPLDLRYYLLCVHYRTNLKFTKKGLEDARKARRKILEWMEEVEKFFSAIRADSGTSQKYSGPLPDDLQKRFTEAMDADLNTPAAMATIFDAVAWMQQQEAGPARALPDAVVICLWNFIQLIRKSFGCFECPQETMSKEVDVLLAQRNEAREKKDFAASDRLRDVIQKYGFEVRDTPQGQKVRKL